METTTQEASNNMTAMQDMITQYHQIRTANALDLSLAQVQRLDILEANADHETTMMFEGDVPFKVTRIGPVSVEFETFQDGILYRGFVHHNGQVVWNR